MQTTSNMGLVTWDLINDYFSHSQLKANWDALDAHDHTLGSGVQIPAGGLANNAVTNSAISAAAVTDDKLASPSNTVFRNLINSRCILTSSLSASQFMVLTDGTVATSPYTGGVTAASYYIKAADLTVPNKTTKLALRGALVTNSAAISGQLTFSLRGLTPSSTAPTLTFSTTGSGTSVAVSPTASSNVAFAGPEFLLPSDGMYCFAVQVNTVLPSTSIVQAYLNLVARHV